MLYKLILVLFIAAVVYGCATKPYSDTNKVYRQQTKQFAAKLKEQPIIEANDTIKIADFFMRPR